MNYREWRNNMSIKYLVVAGVVICVVVIADAAYYLYAQSKNNSGESKWDSKNDGKSPNLEDVEKVVSNKNLYDNLDDAIAAAAEEYSDNCGKAVDNIKNRHEEAAGQMRESLSNILNEDSDIHTENTDTINSMMDQIDNLMD